ncbi:ABC transporter substrate-binding protein [Aquimarina sp. U1-2]|uniref:substrate-binding domain-containing protein n=1 Tax=Aquimarina sp. U1-2 TaxID=2823141 RepID=UPI001AECB74F|nr:substrate-binding domain-containing protein [Aquimarina sp. U1-2]MBP2832029.1 ABC transporter substrate-binding protein [Aquimarina sp. U1-2]
MTTLKIGGVPEHFNLPWHLSIENKSFLDQNIKLEWTDFPGGTGAMCEALRNEEIDIAIILTEGIIKDIIAGNPSKIVQIYIETPLIWGIHVSAASPYKYISDLEHAKAAISRYGSGSHLMAYVNAKNQEWNTDTLQFEVIKNLDGAVDALTKGTADYFMWEHFTTKPLVDQGVFRRIDDCPTPWPCFVIAVRDEILQHDGDTIKNVLDIINNCSLNFKNIPEIDRTLSETYHQKLTDIQKWLAITEWSQSILEEQTIAEIQEQLYALNIIDKKYTYKDLVYKM